MAPRNDKPNFADLRILVVCDRDLQQLLVAVLQELGFREIARAVDTNAAKAHLVHSANRVDFVICRLNLPEGDGLDVLEYLREHRGSTPFLLLAATATGDTIGRAQKLGVSGFLAIPFTADGLKKRVTTIATEWHAENSNDVGQAAAEDAETSEEDVWLIE